MRVYLWSRPPNSERDLVGTRSRYANRNGNAAPPFHLTRNRHRHERKLYKCRNNSIISNNNLRNSLVSSCFSFFLSIELVTKTKRNRLYICVSIWLIFQMIDRSRISLRGRRPKGRERGKTSQWSARRSDAGGSRARYSVTFSLLPSFWLSPSLYTAWHAG